MNDIADEMDLPQIKTIRTEGNSASFEIGPVLAGFSTSFASSLRRVLLFSLLGAAITSVRIQGVQHEFQDIPDVKEDVTDIVQNLKRVRLRSFEDRPIFIHLDVQREGAVRAGDIKTPGTIEIVNPELHIATLDNEQAALSMEMTVGVGRGFVAASGVSVTCPPIGVIPIDAIYSPIVHVNFAIEGDTGLALNKIVLTITTDGTVSPREALRQAADILIQQFSVFRDYVPAPPAQTSQGVALSNVPIPHTIYNVPIEELGLHIRIATSLKRYGVRSVGHILEKDGRELLSLRNIGVKALQEIADRLRMKDFLPGLPLNHWKRRIT